MTRRYWGTLYLIKPDWRGAPDDRAEAVVETYRNGPSDIEVAIELWRLAGCEERARAIEDVMARANDRDYPMLDASEIDELLRGLEGIEAGMRERLLDPDDKVPAARIEMLRNRARLIDFDELPGHVPAYAVLEALSRVNALRNTLADARARGLHVAID